MLDRGRKDFHDTLWSSDIKQLREHRHLLTALVSCTAIVFSSLFDLFWIKQEFSVLQARAGLKCVLGIFKFTASATLRFFVSMI